MSVKVGNNNMMNVRHNMFNAGPAVQKSMNNNSIFGGGRTNITPSCSVHNAGADKLNDLEAMKQILLNLPEDQRPKDFDNVLANINKEIEEIKNCQREEAEGGPQAIPPQEEPQNVPPPQDEE